ncbi:protein translocase subunit SecA [Striga asiatica]|uniref:Protein translocase subunit SecA n=1 Tax=Striga asiatica TaxID=4170 RepID=A0A5A7PFM0_STRAF|nr:protein translocase subunit SecA [Striga asiatica]
MATLTESYLDPDETGFGDYGMLEALKQCRGDSVGKVAAFRVGDGKILIGAEFFTVGPISDPHKAVGPTVADITDLIPADFIIPTSTSPSLHFRRSSKLSSKAHLSISRHGLTSSQLGPDLTRDPSGPDLIIGHGPDLIIGRGPDLAIDRGPDLTMTSPPRHDVNRTQIGSHGTTQAEFGSLRKD